MEAFRSLWQPWVFSQTQEPCSPCSPTPSLPLAPPCFPHPLSLPGPLGSSWSLRKPCEPSEGFGSLGSSVRLKDLAPPHPLLCLAPLTPLAPPCFLSLLGPWDLPGACRKPWEPSEGFGSLGSSVRLRDLAPLAPPHPSLPSSSLAPPYPLSLPGSLRPSWGLRKPWEPSEAFGSLGSSVRLRDLAPPPPCSPLLPEPPWTAGTFLGPQEALQAFGSLWQP